MSYVLIVIFIALVFEYINGFHDTANAIATIVATKVLSARKAILLAATTNLLGALSGTAVASTIGKGLVDTNFITTDTICSGLLAGIIWNLLTWWFGLPSSSSHALIGGLIGSTLSAANNNFEAIKFITISESGEKGGVLYKVLIPMICSPIIGMIASLLVMGILYAYISRFRPKKISTKFKQLQICSSAWMGFAHGLNDAQKTMGIITLCLIAATNSGELNNIPSWLWFLKTYESPDGKLVIASWVKIICALTMAMGTMAGGWRIIKTLGHRLVFLKPINGFAAETTAAIIIQTASSFGMPLSTTHVISSCILGVGTAKSLSNANWSIVRRMILAWIFTIPVCMLLGYLISWVLN